MKYIAGFLMLLISGGFSSRTETANYQDKRDFWRSQKKGANMNMTGIRPGSFESAQENGFQFIRFNVSWLVADERDFLIGDTDHFTHLNQRDLETLLAALDTAEKYHQKIVLTLFELPGCRDGNADGTNDYRLWHDEAFQEQAFRFWKELASAVKNHPAVVAYDPLNEPHPAREFGIEEPGRAFDDWLGENEGTPADLNRFNRRMVAAIREADPVTPILLEGYFYTDVQGLPYMEAINDPTVLYSFHNPAPWQFATFRANRGRYRYPGNMPRYWDDPGVVWTIDSLRKLVAPVKRFMEKNKIEPWRIVASEVLCDRRVEGCAAYLKDMISIYNEQHWHWSFYAFREDLGWNGLDYEVGSDPVPAGFYQAIEDGADYNELNDKLRHDNPIWDVIQSEFKERKSE